MLNQQFLHQLTMYHALISLAHMHSRWGNPLYQIASEAVFQFCLWTALQAYIDIKKRHPHTQTLTDKHPQFYCFVSTPLQTPFPLLWWWMELILTFPRLVPTFSLTSTIVVGSAWPLQLGDCPAGTTRGRWARATCVVDGCCWSFCSAPSWSYVNISSCLEM